MFLIRCVAFRAILYVEDNLDVMSFKGKALVPVLLLVIFSLSVSGLQDVNVTDDGDVDYEFKGDLPEEDDDLHYTSANESDDDNQYSGPPVNGTFVLKLDVNASNSSNDEFEIIDVKRIEDRKYLRGLPSGITHSVRVLDRNGEVMVNESFGIVSRSHSDRRYSNGSWAPTKIEKSFYSQVIFAFDANYSARKVVVEERDETVLSFKIPEKLCRGSEELHYCEWNNISYTELPEEPGSMPENTSEGVSPGGNVSGKSGEYSDSKKGSAVLEVLNFDWLTSFF